MKRTMYRATAAAVKAATAAVAVLAAASPATAAAASGARASAIVTRAGIPTAGLFGLEPLTGVGGPPRAYFMLTIAAGSSATDAVVVSNGGPTTETLRIGVSNGITAANSGSAYGAVPDRCDGPGCWVTGLPGTVVLKPYQQEALTFRVAVPAAAEPNQYLAGITAEPKTRPQASPPKPGAREGTRVVIVNTVTVGVAVTVGRLSQLRAKTVITGVTAGYIQALVRLSIAVHNVGQRFTRGDGEIACKLGSVSRTYPVYMDTVLPDGSAELAVNGVGMQPGTWLCAVHLTDSPAGTASWTGDVVVAAAVAAATKRIGNDDYVAPSAPGIPTWAIVLMVLGGFILFSIWAVILRRNHDRNLGKPTDT